MYIYIYIYMYICIYIYIYTYTCMYVHIMYTYITESPAKLTETRLSDTTCPTQVFFKSGE